jgi:hypothetical protein
MLFHLNVLCLFLPIRWIDYARQDMSKVDVSIEMMI